jgi:hypothetical protein
VARGCAVAAGRGEGVAGDAVAVGVGAAVTLADGDDCAMADDDGLGGVGPPHATKTTTRTSQTGRSRNRCVSMTGRRYDRAVVAPVGAGWTKVKDRTGIADHLFWGRLLVSQNELASGFLAPKFDIVAVRPVIPDVVEPALGTVTVDVSSV